MAASLQLLTHLRVVVAFAVEDDPDRTILVGNGLIPAAHINDGKAAHRQPDAGGFMEAVAVRPAMGNGRVHFFKQRVLGLTLIGVGNTANTAHKRVNPFE